MQVTLKNLHTNIVKFVEDKNDLEQLPDFLKDIYGERYIEIDRVNTVSECMLYIDLTTYYVDIKYQHKFVYIEYDYANYGNNFIYLACHHTGDQYFISYDPINDCDPINDFLKNTGKTVDELDEDELLMLNILLEMI